MHLRKYRPNPVGLRLVRDHEDWLDQWTERVAAPALPILGGGAPPIQARH
jgi:hypothetical protein